MDSLIARLESALGGTDIFGYFDDPSQDEPTFDPGLGVKCPLCLESLTRPMKTISLMSIGDDRSYFYRVHKACYENAPADEIADVEGALIDHRAALKAKEHD